PRVLELATAELNRLPTVTGTQPQASSAFTAVLADAQERAKSMGDSYTTLEHLLLAISDSSGKATDALELGGIKTAELQRAVESMRRDSGVDTVVDPGAESTFEALKKYGIDLNER
ncbi:MAG: Clp protease N-terminal domain-containing protein, partial [Phycisphaerales bacterium]|nr:Clp protease N-terminal domain-containing protein [Phycisphaerales bacterium]